MQVIEANGWYHPGKRIVDGDTVYQGQDLRFTEDISPPSTITYVHCYIDGKDYSNFCNQAWEGKTWSSIWNNAIPSGTPAESGYSHYYTVFVDTPNGRTNTATFRFLLWSSATY